MIKKWEKKSNRERRERAEMSIMWRFQAATSNPPQSALPIDVAQLVAADGAWCECGGSDGTLPPRGRGSGGSHWLILNAGATNDLFIWKLQSPGRAGHDW